jgi:adenylate cyclase
VILALALAVLVAGGLAAAAYATDAFRALELNTVDRRFEIRGERKPPADMVIVAIDRKTLNTLRAPAPFPHDAHAAVVERLRADGAKVIAFDLEFISPRGGERAALALVNAIAEAGNVITASSDVRNGNANAFTYVVPDPVLSSREPGAIAAWLRRNMRLRVGYPGFPADPGGVLRRVGFETRGVPAFALAVAAKASGKSIAEMTPAGDEGWIDFYGPPDTIRQVSYSDVRRGLTPTGAFRGKIVLIGNTAPILQDSQQTATSGNGVMVGPEIEANAVGTALAGFPLTDSRAGLDLALIFALGLIVPAASLVFRPLRSLALAVMVGAIYAFLTQIAFNGGLILPVVYPVGALALGAVSALVIHYLAEAIERQRTRDAFARFVPPSVVDDALREAGGVRLGGVSREATVMFSDLRGFTSFAETLEPDQVIHILNHYLTRMVNNAILPKGGTLVDYMGDGIMAVFGAPIEMPDHADRALAAARAMLEELALLNQWLRELGFEKTFRMGIGLNSGRVMSGMVGSEERLAYTAIGDTTNVAARLEAATKDSDYMLFIARSTRDRLSVTPLDLTFVESIALRGRQEKLKVWSLEQALEGPRKSESFVSVLEPR